MTTSVPPKLTVVWFKRDLRLQDHEPLHHAVSVATDMGYPVLPLYLFEPDIMADPHHSERHWRFVWQSLLAMQRTLQAAGGELHVSYENAVAFYRRLIAAHPHIEVVSYAETGLHCTFERDKQLSALLKAHNVNWQEFPYAGVQRGITHRRTWHQRWQQVMAQPALSTDLHHPHWYVNKSLVNRVPGDIAARLHQPDDSKQPGGEHHAHKLLVSFLTDRHTHYHRHISSPLASFNSCSRLSPYLAWGNISLRQVYQALNSAGSKRSRSLSAFASRLHWHCHFIQKFESECEQEFRAVNHAYKHFPYRDDDKVEADLAAWKTGTTGIPMVDACMRCVNHTGYLNFRMRAMLVSFLTHYLLIDWRLGVQHLARQFLDFEPGIHYPQFQMQAGVTGTNTLRIYNPVKQAEDNDPDGSFIRQWVPEIAHLPNEELFAPWLIPPLTHMAMEQPVPERYLHPVAQPDEAITRHRDLLWNWRKRDDVKREARRILHRHSIPASQVKPNR